MILPNVGLNEWGHAFWFVDELFAAPLHWGFVILGWCGLFGGTGGVAAQVVARVCNLCGVGWNDESKDCLQVILYSDVQRYSVGWPRALGAEERGLPNGRGRREK